MGLTWSMKKKAGVRTGRRSAAEGRIARSPEKVSDESTKTPEEIIRELEIRQIELEIQNEDLNEARQISDELLDLYLNLFDLAPVGYFTLTDEARISQVNLAGADLIGVARKNLINEQFRQFVSTESREVWDQFFFSLQDQDTKQIGMINLRSTRGTTIPTRIEGNRIKKGDPIYQIRVIVSDISDLKQIEHELRESEERFRLLFKEAPIPYQSLDNDGRFLDVNDAWVAMLGYDRDEVIGHWFGDFLPIDQKYLFMERFPILKKKGIVHETLFSMQKKNAEVILVSFEGKIAYNSDGSFRQTHCILQDITEKNRAEDALRESEEKFRTLYTNMETGVFYQRADSTLIDCNPAVLKMFGITREEFLSQTSMDSGGKVIQADGTPFPVDEHPSMVALLSGMPVRGVIAGIFHPVRQEYVWVSIDGIPQYRPGGIEPYQVFVTLHEITSPIETEEAMKASLSKRDPAPEDPPSGEE